MTAHGRPDRIELRKHLPKKYSWMKETNVETLIFTIHNPNVSGVETMLFQKSRTAANSLIENQNLSETHSKNLGLEGSFYFIYLRFIVYIRLEWFYPQWNNKPRSPWPTEKNQKKNSAYEMKNWDLRFEIKITLSRFYRVFFSEHCQSSLNTLNMTSHNSYDISFRC